MYTYAFAFFVETQNNNYDIFVGNQKDLENATEKLSQFLENHQGELSKHQSVLTDMYK
jgi:predicted esterase